jgi:hypothetical protein
MDKTTEIVFKKTLHFPTVCVGVGRGQGFKTITVDICLATQLCKDWETLEERRMYVFTAMAHCKGHWGQCLDFIQENAEKYMIPDEKKALYNRIYNIWREYHLNDMQKEIPAEIVAEIMTWKDVEDLSHFEIEQMRRKARNERVAR